ncbi:13229_t:CDS:2, partial [Ambispora gerdemannii]
KRIIENRSFTLGPAPRAATSFSYHPKWRGLFRLKNYVCLKDDNSFDNTKNYPTKGLLENTRWTTLMNILNKENSTERPSPWTIKCRTDIVQNKTCSRKISSSDHYESPKNITTRIPIVNQASFVSK